MMIKKILKFLSNLFSPKKKKRTSAPVRQNFNQVTQPAKSTQPTKPIQPTNSIQTAQTVQPIQVEKDNQKLNLTKNPSVAPTKIEEELKPISKPEVEVKSEIKPKVKIESKSESELKEQEPKAKVETKAEVKTELQPKVELKSEIKSEVKVDPKSNLESEIKSESKEQESKAESEPKVKSEVKPEPKVEQKPQTESNSNSKSKSDIKSESKFEKETEPELKAENTVKPKANNVAVHNAPSEKAIDYIKAKAMAGDIIIPNSMNEIPARLFDGNKKITSVTIPGTVKKIGDRAFAECVNLEKVILNEGIEEIKSNVFTGCEKLRSVTYPDSVKKYQGWTFWRTKLTEPVMNVSKTILIFCPKSVSGKEWSVPDTVKIISWQAFIEDKDLEILHLPKGLEVIERMAFIECGLKKITIPYSVREIGAESFWCCEQLEEVNILNPNTKVGVNAFSKCKNLKEIKYGKPNKPSKIVRLKD